MRLKLVPAAEEEESADKVTVVLVAAAAEGFAGRPQVAPVGVGHGPVVAVDETVTAAVWGAAEAPGWILGSWTGPVIQGLTGNSVAEEPDWGAPAAGHRETGQTVELRIENKVAVTVGALEMGLAVAPGIVGACGAADKVVPPGYVKQTLVEGVVALGKMSGHQVVQVVAGSMAFVADRGEDPVLAGHNRVPGLETHSFLVPAVHKIPS